jgi:hypothetical protein
MECVNHPTVQAVDRCAGCAEPFCADCLVDLKGKKYCAKCKVMVLSGRTPVPPASAMRKCQEADDALKYAIIGIFCFGIILEPVAISKALKARKMMAADPTLEGSGKVTAALWIGGIALGLWVVGMIVRISNMT